MSTLVSNFLSNTRLDLLVQSCYNGLSLKAGKLSFIQGVVQTLPKSMAYHIKETYVELFTQTNITFRFIGWNTFKSIIDFHMKIISPHRSPNDQW